MVGSVIGGIFGKMGADAQAAAADRAAEQQREATELARKDLSPWRSAGRAALDEASRLLGLGYLETGADGFDTIAGYYDPAARRTVQDAARERFQTDPGYEFRVGEGQKAIDRSLAARGGALSGTAVKAGIRFNSDIASQEFNNYFNRLTGLAGSGGQAATSSANIGVQGAKAAGDDLIAAGNARASGYNALGTGIANGFNNVLLSGMYAKNRGWI